MGKQTQSLFWKQFRPSQWWSKYTKNHLENNLKYWNSNDTIHVSSWFPTNDGVVSRMSSACSVTLSRDDHCVTLGPGNHRAGGQVRPSRKTSREKGLNLKFYSLQALSSVVYIHRVTSAELQCSVTAAANVTVSRVNSFDRLGAGASSCYGNKNGWIIKLFLVMIVHAKWLKWSKIINNQIFQVALNISKQWIQIITWIV